VLSSDRRYSITYERAHPARCAYLFEPQTRCLRFGAFPFYKQLLPMVAIIAEWAREQTSTLFSPTTI
jgi:hypothetical protein